MRTPTLSHQLIAEFIAYSVFLCTQDGDTALHVAASHCHVSVVKLLVKTGAPVNAKNKVFRY